LRKVTELRAPCLLESIEHLETFAGNVGRLPRFAAVSAERLWD
jgi:hypothetical protein